MTKATRGLASRSRHFLEPLSPNPPGIFLLGLVFGFVTAIVGEFDLTQTWLLIAYGLVVYILLTAFLYDAPQARRLQPRSTRALTTARLTSCRGS
jgi:hypothetical protein